MKGANVMSDTGARGERCVYGVKRNAIVETVIGACCCNKNVVDGVYGHEQDGTETIQDIHAVKAHRTLQRREGEKNNTWKQMRCCAVARRGHGRFLLMHAPK